MNRVRQGGSTTFETKSSYCRVARQGLLGGILCVGVIEHLLFSRLFLRYGPITTSHHSLAMVNQVRLVRSVCTVLWAVTAGYKWW